MQLIKYLISQCQLLIIASLAFFLFPFNVMAEYVSPDRINLIDPPLDSIQKTLWRNFPVLVHRRTGKQIESIEVSFDQTPDESQRYLSYQSLARSFGNEFASVIREFTESYIKNRNVYMSELPEYGIFSMVSPILGCAVFKNETGFIDPCNGVEFDFAGKTKSHSEYTHLRLLVPPHKLIENKLVFLDDYKVKEIIDFTPDILQMNLPAIDKALYAIDWERKDILATIIEQNPEVLQQENNAGTTLLQMAALHDKTLDYLLKFDGLNISHLNNAGYTALMFAVWNKKFDNAEKLIKYGATPQSYFYQETYVPTIYEFMVREYLFSEETARKIYDGFLETEKETQKKK